MNSQTDRVGGRPKSGMEEKVKEGTCGNDTASACSDSLVHTGGWLLQGSKLAPRGSRQF